MRPTKPTMAHTFICKTVREQYWMSPSFLGWSTAANGSNGLGRIGSEEGYGIESRIILVAMVLVLR